MGEKQTSWTENAYEWLQRSRRKLAIAEIPRDPSSAAWAFMRKDGTGIAFVDAALRRQTDQLPVIDVRGDIGKTWTILSLASRFVFATRPSQFQKTLDDTIPLPQVIILDSTYDVTAPKLAYTIRSNLLRKMESSDEQAFQEDMESCLRRIHVASADDTGGWVPILESIRCKLAPFSSEHPTLVLWDGFLSDSHDEASRMEVIRQLDRLVQDCSIMLLTTSSGNRKQEWDKFVTHRIKLERNQSASTDGHEFLATVHGSRIPFSLSLAGVLS